MTFSWIPLNIVILVTPEGGSAEQFLSALQTEAQNQEMHGGFDLILFVLKFDDFGIGK